MSRRRSGHQSVRRRAYRARQHEFRERRSHAERDNRRWPESGLASETRELDTDSPTAAANGYRVSLKSIDAPLPVGMGHLE